MENLSNIIWTAKEVARATNAQATGDWQAYAVSIDSRSVEKGDLFVALMGDNADGHDYVKMALDKGAVAAIVTRQIEGVSADKLLIVEDTLIAMQDLAKAARARVNAKIIG